MSSRLIRMSPAMTNALVENAFQDIGQIRAAALAVRLREPGSACSSPAPHPGVLVLFLFLVVSASSGSSSPSVRQLA